MRISILIYTSHTFVTIYMVHSSSSFFELVIKARYATKITIYLHALLDI